MTERETPIPAGEPSEGGLDRLEAEEIERLKGTLAQVLDSEEVDRMLASLTAIIHRRVTQSLHELPRRLAESVVQTLVRPHPFQVDEVLLGNWHQAATGCAWLEPSQAVTLAFRAGSRLTLLYDPDFGEGQVSMEAQGDEAVAKFGFLSAARHIPMEIQVEAQGGPTLALLLQAYATPTPFAGGVILRLDYSLYFREV
ncbi:MAG: hypothetical protein AB7S38_40205 [Vulcanimicrobiota bacterium]